jgi:hypothetical protein
MNTNLLIAYLLKNMVAITTSMAENYGKKKIGFYIPIKIPLINQLGKPYFKELVLVTPEYYDCQSMEEYNKLLFEAQNYMSRMLDIAFNTGALELVSGKKYDVAKDVLEKMTFEQVLNSKGVVITINKID